MCLGVCSGGGCPFGLVMAVPKVAVPFDYGCPFRFRWLPLSKWLSLRACGRTFELVMAVPSDLWSVRTCGPFGLVAVPFGSGWLSQSDRCPSGRWDRLFRLWLSLPVRSSDLWLSLSDHGCPKDRLSLPVPFGSWLSLSTMAVHGCPFHGCPFGLVAVPSMAVPSMAVPFDYGCPFLFGGCVGVRRDYGCPFGRWVGVPLGGAGSQTGSACSRNQAANSASSISRAASRVTVCTTCTSGALSCNPFSAVKM